MTQDWFQNVAVLVFYSLNDLIKNIIIEFNF